MPGFQNIGLTMPRFAWLGLVPAVITWLLICTTLVLVIMLLLKQLKK